MSKYVAVEREELEKLHALIANLSDSAMGTGSSSDGLTWPIRDEVVDRINHWLKNPLTLQEPTPPETEARDE